MKKNEKGEIIIEVPIDHVKAKDSEIRRKTYHIHREKEI